MIGNVLGLVAAAAVASRRYVEGWEGSVRVAVIVLFISSFIYGGGGFGFSTTDICVRCYYQFLCDSPIEERERRL